MNPEKLNHIISGWKNVVFKNKDVEELAIVRAKICSECPHANPNYPFKKFLPEEGGKTKIIEGMGCNLCGCPLSAKVRAVLDSCPDNPKRWD